MELNKLNNYTFILASQSPRRRQLLEELGLKFECVGKHIPEDYPDTLQAREVAIYLSELKAKAFDEYASPQNILITADTVVSLDSHILGKPKNAEEAIKMLQLLSGKKHEVISAVCLRKENYFKSFAVVTEVYFKTLSLEEIQYYVNTFKPMDKAGAYGIQEWIGLIGIEKIRGSYFNVMGLPVKELYEHLLEICTN